MQSSKVVPNCAWNCSSYLNRMGIRLFQDSFFGSSKRNELAPLCIDPEKADELFYLQFINRQCL